MESWDRFDIFKEACKLMDEGKWQEAEKMFRKLSNFCWKMFLEEHRSWV